MKAIKNIETKLNQLSPSLIEELNRYLDYLINKQLDRKANRLTQDWAGELKGENYTSVALQKKALDWRQE